MNFFLQSLRSFLFATLLVLLSACATAPDESRVPMPPVPETPPADSGEIPVGLPPGLQLMHKGEVIRLEDIESKSLPPDATITVTAARNVTYPAINDILKKIHEQGYLLEFRVAE